MRDYQKKKNYFRFILCGTGTLMLTVSVFIMTFTSSVSAAELTPGDYRFSFWHDGYQRFYNMHIPASYDGSHAVPVIIDLHGIYQTGKKQKRYSGLDRLADTSDESFIVVYPDGIDHWGLGKYSWSATIKNASFVYQQWWYSWASFLDNFVNDTNDVGFIVRITEELPLQVNVDQSRVYLTGISQGGAMALRCAYERSDLFAAIAVVSTGTLLDPERYEELPTPIPVRTIHAFEDQLIPYDGKTSLGKRIMSANEHINKWAEINGCSTAETVEEVLHEYSAEELSAYDESHRFNDMCRTYTRCRNGVEVGLCSIHGVHDIYNYQSLDGSMSINHHGDFEIAQLIWDFVSRFKSY